MSVASTRAQKSANAARCSTRHELAETLVDHGVAVQSQQGGPGQVDLQNPPLLVPQEIRNRGEIEQVAVPLRRLLGRCLGALEFLVLHLQFDLMHLQLVDQGASVRFGHGQSRSGLTQVQTLLCLAALQGQLRSKTGPAKETVLRLVAMSVVRRLSRGRTASQGLHQRDHFMAVNGLGQVGIHSRRQAPLPVALHRVGRHGDDRHADTGLGSWVLGLGFWESEAKAKELRPNTSSSRLRIAAVASKPFIPGICTSIRITS